MLVLLPPSEGKAPSGRGTALKLESLSLPGLTEARRAVLDELAELCAGDEEKAREVLGLSEGLRGEIAKNTQLRSAGARPAGEIYTGVLVRPGPGLAGHGGQAARQPLAAGLFSGLWGALRVTDRIPSYRCSMGVSCRGRGARRAPGVRRWPPRSPRRPVTGRRSTCGPRRTRARGSRRARWPGGRRRYGCLHAPTRKVVSHFNKATKGRIVRSLLAAGAAPADPAELVETLRDLGYEVEVQAPARAGTAWALDVLVNEVH